MKLVIAVIQIYDTDRLLTTATDVGFGATRIVSTGGFLRMQNATVLLGVDDERVEEAIGIIRECCQGRVEVRAEVAAPEFAEWIDCGIQEIPLGGGVVFVVAVDRFARITPGVGGGAPP